MGVPQILPGTGKSFFLKFCAEEADAEKVRRLLDDLWSESHSMPVSGAYLRRGKDSPHTTFYGVLILQKQHKKRVRVQALPETFRPGGGGV